IAGPESPGYKLRKFVRRNKTSVAAGAVVMATLVLATGISIWFGVQASIQRNEAVTAAARAASIKDFMIQTLESNQTELAGRQDVSVSEAILKGTDRLKEGALKEQPLIRAEILGASADILRSNGKSEVALPLAEEALSLTRRTHPGDDLRVARSL